MQISTPEYIEKYRKLKKIANKVDYTIKTRYRQRKLENILKYIRKNQDCSSRNVG